MICVSYERLLGRRNSRAQSGFSLDQLAEEMGFWHRLREHRYRALQSVA